MAKKRKAPKPNAEYVLPASLGGRPEKLLLAMDPGSRNFGIALVGIEKGKPRVYANSVLTRPLNDLVAFNAARTIFLKEIAGWMAFKPDGIIGERFQTRGNGGPLIEQVSAMLGLIGGQYPKVPVKLTIASAWKNAFNTRFSCDLKEIYPEIGVQPHQLDAALIGVYGLEKGTGIKLEYKPADIIKQVESTSLIGLRKRKQT